MSELRISVRITPTNASALFRLTPSQRAVLLDAWDGRCAACGGVIDVQAARSDGAGLEVDHTPRVSAYTQADVERWEAGHWAEMVRPLHRRCHQDATARARAAKPHGVAPRARRGRPATVPAWAPLAHALVNVVTGKPQSRLARDLLAGSGLQRRTVAPAPQPPDPMPKLTAAVDAMRLRP